MKGADRFKQKILSFDSACSAITTRLSTETVRKNLKKKIKEKQTI